MGGLEGPPISPSADTRCAIALLDTQSATPSAATIVTSHIEVAPSQPYSSPSCRESERARAASQPRGRTHHEATHVPENVRDSARSCSGVTLAARLDRARTAEGLQSAT